MKTEKKKGRGRPKKVTDSRKETVLAYDITTNKMVEIEEPLEKAEKSLYKDFSITIDNATPNGDVRFIEEGNKEIRALFLSDFYLNDVDFRNFINKIITDAAREKANNLANTLQSIAG